MNVSSDHCQFCNRRKQISTHWSKSECVCCDVHEGQCNHRPKLALSSLQSLERSLKNPLTNKTERMTITKQCELTKKWREQ